LALNSVAEWDMESVSVAMASKCQCVELLFILGGYMVACNPVDHHQLCMGVLMLQCGPTYMYIVGPCRRAADHLVITLDKLAAISSW